MHQEEYRIMYVASALRGFHRHILLDPPPNVRYLIREGNSRFFEVKPWYKTVVAKCWRSKLGDMLGLIQRLRISAPPREHIDAAQVFNRFAKSTVTYVIYLENPTALYHYKVNRLRSSLGWRKIRKLCADPLLRAVVCMSRRCLDTLDALVPFLPQKVMRLQIYPYVRQNPYVSVEQLKKRSRSEMFRCLYVSSNFSLKGGEEIVTALGKLVEDGMKNVSLVIVTRRASIPGKYQKLIDQLGPNVQLVDFNMPFEKLETLYASVHVLLHPTLKDSQPMVVLEAMKAGLPIIGSSLYAIPEMVREGENGYLKEPSIWWWTPQGLPNEEIWDHEEILIHRCVDNAMVNFIAEKVAFLNENRDAWLRMACRSWELATKGPFSREDIHRAWRELFDRILG